MRKNYQSILAQLGVLIIFVLQVVWHMPGTIALRNGLLGLFLLVTVGLFIILRKSASLSIPKLPGILLGLLTAWIIVVNFAWGTHPDVNWPEFLSHWLLPAVCGVLAWMFGALVISSGLVGAIGLLLTVFWAYLTQVFLHDAMSGIFYLETGQIPFRNAPVLDIPEMLRNWRSIHHFSEGFSARFFGFFSYVNAILAAILTAETVQRFLEKRRCLPVGNWLLAVGFLLVIVCSYILKARNGNIGLLMLLIFSAIMIAYRLAPTIKPWRIVAALSLFLVVTAAIGMAFVRSDPRWQTLTQTVPVAWDTQTHKAWLYGPPYPQLPNGQEADGSNYERIAWIKEGWLLLLEKPLGSGYDRNAWGGRLDDKYQMGGATRGGHSHNGILDLAIATGFPGVIIWIAFMFSIGIAGFSAFRQGKITPGLFLVFLVTGYFGRTAVDSVIRDHFLQVFMFLSGLLLSICSPTNITKRQ